MIVTSSELQARQIFIKISDEDEVESVAVEIESEEGHIHLGTIYIPSSSRTWEKDEYRKVIEDLAFADDAVILAESMEVLVLALETLHKAKPGVLRGAMIARSAHN